MSSRDWPEDAPEGDYMMFDKGTDEDKAAARFEAKHGQPPEWIHEAAGFLWLGPIPSQGAGGLWAGGPLPACEAACGLDEEAADV